MSSLLFIWIILNPLAPKSDLHVTSLNKMHTTVYIQQTGHQTYSVEVIILISHRVLVTSLQENL